MKVKEKDVPQKLLERAYKEFESKENNKEIICFYICNNIYDVISEAEVRAMKMLEVGFSVRTIGKKYLINTFGQAFADSVYDYEMECNIPRRRRR